MIFVLIIKLKIFIQKVSSRCYDYY